MEAGETMCCNTTDGDISKIFFSPTAESAAQKELYLQLSTMAQASVFGLDEIFEIRARILRGEAPGEIDVWHSGIHS